MKDIFQYPFLDIPYLWCRYQIRQWRVKTFKGSGPRIENRLDLIRFYHTRLEEHLTRCKGAKWDNFTLSPTMLFPSRVTGLDPMKHLDWMKSMEWPKSMEWLKLPWPEEPSSIRIVLEGLTQDAYKRIEGDKDDPVWQAALKVWKAEDKGREKYEKALKAGTKKEEAMRQARIAAGKEIFPHKAKKYKRLNDDELKALHGLYRDTVKVCNAGVELLKSHGVKIIYNDDEKWKPGKYFETSTLILQAKNGQIRPRDCAFSFLKGQFQVKEESIEKAISIYKKRTI